MNVIGSRPDGWWRDRRGAMRRLVEELGSLARVSSEPVTVVLDGRAFDLDGGPVEVRFASRPGRTRPTTTSPRSWPPTPSRATCAWSPRTPRSRGACASTAPRWRAPARSGGGSTSWAAVADPRYSTALLDWLACAARGAEEPAARAAGALDDPVAAAATAGHVLDFDDTYLPGIAHLSAPTAPVALALAADRGGGARRLRRRLRGDGGAGAGEPSRALRPRPASDRRLRRGGGGGDRRAADRARSRRRALGDRARAAGRRRAARRVRLGREGAPGRMGRGRRGARRAAGGRRGERAARRGGARASPRRPAAATRSPDEPSPPSTRNWIKAWPCCLQTHGSIEAAERAREAGAEPAAVVVHPVSLQAAGVGPEPADGLQAKFSIPYLIAYTLLHGSPTLASFDGVDAEAARRATAIDVRTDRGLLESEAVLLDAAGDELARVEAALGSPERPLDAAALERKVGDLAGDRLAGALDDPERPAAERARARGARALIGSGIRSTMPPPDLAHGNGGTHGRGSADRRRELEREDSQPARGDRAHADHARHLLLLLVVLHQPGDARPRQGPRRGPRAEARQLGLGGHARRAHHRPGDRVRVEHERARSSAPRRRWASTGPRADR